MSPPASLGIYRKAGVTGGVPYGEYGFYCSHLLEVSTEAAAGSSKSSSSAWAREREPTVTMRGAISESFTPRCFTLPSPSRGTPFGSE